MSYGCMLRICFNDSYRGKKYINIRDGKGLTILDKKNVVPLAGGTASIPKYH